MVCDINLAAFGREQIWGKALERKRKIYSDNSLQIEELQPPVETQRASAKTKERLFLIENFPTVVPSTCQFHVNEVCKL